MDSLLPQPLAQSNQQRPTLARTSQNHPPPSPAFLNATRTPLQGLGRSFLPKTQHLHFDQESGYVGRRPSRRRRGLPFRLYLSFCTPSDPPHFSRVSGRGLE